MHYEKLVGWYKKAEQEDTFYSRECEFTWRKFCVQITEW